MKGAGDPLRVALYARVSSEQQAAVNTIASQVAALRERVAQDGYALDESCCFLDDGYSGMTLIRPGLERLRDRAAAGDIDRLYLLDPDRLARQYAYVTVLIEELQQGGVEVVFLKGPLGNSAEDKLLLQVQGMLAEYERAKLLDRCRRGRRHSARSGSVSAIGKAPYGYRYVPKRLGAPACYEVAPAEADVVRQIFVWVGQERLSLGAVCQRLQAQGIRTRKGLSQWSRHSVFAILKNPAYHGVAQYGKTRVGQRRPRCRSARGRPEHSRRSFSLYATEASERISIAVPALVSSELFAVVQEQLQENRKRYRQRRQGARYLLQGLLVCQQCGYAVCGKSNKSVARAGPRQYVYYGCLGTHSTRHGGRPPCRLPLLAAELLEQTVWQDVQRLLADPEQVAQEYQRRLQAAPGAAAPEAQARHKQRKQIERGLAGLIDAYADGLLDKKEFEPRVRRAKDRLAQLQSQETTTRDQEAHSEDLRRAIGGLRTFATAIQDGLEHADWSTKREIVRTLIKQIDLTHQEVKIVYRIDPRPFVEGPQRGLLQNCLRLHASHASQICAPCTGNGLLQQEKCI